MTPTFVEVFKNEAYTQNGALSNDSSGDPILDYFSHAGTYRGRSYENVASDMSKIFNCDEELALRMVFYNRLVTRKYEETVQAGQGQRDEFIKSLQWISQNRPHLLENNLYLVPVVGCWKDLWHDSAFTKYFFYANPEKVYALIGEAIAFSDQANLIAKYLPKIRSTSNCTTERHQRLNKWARGLCSFMGWNEEEYRKFKSNPERTAHRFQRLMCSNKWKELKYSEIPGRFLFKLINSGKGGKDSVLKRHQVEDRYIEWLTKQPVVKFTGTVDELVKAARSRTNLAQKITLDKQFLQLLERVKAMSSSEPKKILPVLDTSGSMSGKPIEVCLGLGLLFSELYKGWFQNKVMMFDSSSRIHQIHGESFCEKLDSIPANAMGSTNFQSVVNELVRIRSQNPEIPVEEYPDYLLVISDMQFNPPDHWGRNIASNHQVAVQKLEKVGLGKVQFVWWNVNGEYNSDSPSTLDDDGVMLLSGYDGSILNFLMDFQDEQSEQNEKVSADGNVREKTKIDPYSAMLKALSQPILQLLRT